MTALRRQFGPDGLVEGSARPDFRVRPAMEGRLASDDRVVRRALRENLRKARLQRLDPDWTARWPA